MDIKVKFEVTREEMYRNARYYYSRMGRPWVRWLLGSVFIFFGLLLLLGSFLAHEHKHTGVFTPVAIALFSIAYAVFVFYVPSINAFFIVRRYFSNPNLGGTFEYEFTDAHFASKSRVGEGTTQWNAFSSWVESPEAILLVVYKAHYIFVLKRGFENEGDIDQFRQFLTARLGPKAF